LSKQKTDVKLWIGIAISALFLFLLFRKIDFYKLAAAFREMDYRYLAPALFLTFVSYFLRALRWKFLLAPIRPTRLANLFPSTLIGYMANNLLPARLGEFVRAYSLGQKEGIGTGAVFGSLVVDRLCDGFTVLLVLLVTLFTVRLPEGMEHLQQGMVTGGYVTFLLYLGVMVFLALLKMRTEWTVGVLERLLGALSPRLGEKAAAQARAFISGIRFRRGCGGGSSDLAMHLGHRHLAGRPAAPLLRGGTPHPGLHVHHGVPGVRRDGPRLAGVRRDPPLRLRHRALRLQGGG
jgi:glycosyltransferase 2 family protein